MVQRPTAARPPKRPIALTGTPGTGKSAVAGALATTWRVVEVERLARQARAGRGPLHRAVVDLPALRRWMRRPGAPSPDVIVGHLAHLLPVSGAIVLRCDPLVLRRRLGRARRGTGRERQSNFVAESIDLVLREARERGLPVWEIDASRASVRTVARRVEAILAGEVRPGSARVDWLSDAAVTAHLLDRPS